MMGNGRAVGPSPMGIKSIEKITIATKNRDDQCFANTGRDIITPGVFLVQMRQILPFAKILVLAMLSCWLNLIQRVISSRLKF